MILLAYGCLALFLPAFISRRGVFQLSNRARLFARVFGMIGATATASIALFLIRSNHASTLGVVLLGRCARARGLVLGIVALLVAILLVHGRMPPVSLPRQPSTGCS